jgi:aconitate hydratase
MGILPLQFADGASRETLGLTGKEVYSVDGISPGVSPGKRMTVEAVLDGRKTAFQAVARIDTPEEVRYFLHGGILPYVLRRLIGTGTE